MYVFTYPEAKYSGDTNICYISVGINNALRFDLVFFRDNSFDHIVEVIGTMIPRA